MLRLTQATLRTGLALTLAGGLAVAASAQPARSLDARLDRLGERLSVTPSQATALDAVTVGDAPADSWAAAAAVLDVLTDAQVADLRETRADRRGDRTRRGDRERRRGGATRGRRGGQDGRRGDRRGRVEMTDAQRDAVRAVRDDVQAQRRALAEQLRDGAVSDVDFLTRSEALRNDAQRRLDAVLPADARRDERREQREAQRDAREQALGITDAQREQMQARRLDRIRNAPEPLDMRPFLDADGQLDRSAYRDAVRAQRQGARADRQAQGEILTDAQRDLVTVHRAIAGRGGDGRRGRRRGR